MDKTEKTARLIFLLLTGFSVLFQLFHIGGLWVNNPFLSPYTTVAFVGIGLMTLSFLFALLHRYLPTLLGVTAGVLLLIGSGFAMTHPAANEEGQTLTGIPESVLWKFFIPTLLLLIPAVILVIHGQRERRRREDAIPYEKQF